MASIHGNHLKGALLAEGIDENRQQLGVQLLHIFQDNNALGAALQEAGQLLLDIPWSISVLMRWLASLRWKYTKC